MSIIFSFFRRVGSDPYYLNYEKSFEKIATKEQLIQERGAKRRKWMQDLSSRSMVWSAVWAIVMAAGWAWVNREHMIVPYSRTWFVCAGVSVGVLQLLVFLALFLRKVLGMLERRDGVYLKRLQDSRKKMLKELKDSTHFEKTMALLRKFDPEARPPPPPPQRPGGTPLGRNGNLTPVMVPGQGIMTPSSQILMRTGGAVMAGASKALFPMFDTLANTMIGDNPQLLDELRRIQQEADRLRQENAALKRQVAALGGSISTGGEEGQALLALGGPPSPDILPDNSITSTTGSEGGRAKDGLAVQGSAGALSKVSQGSAEAQDLEPGQSRSGDQGRAGSAGPADMADVTFQPGPAKSQLRARKGAAGDN